MQAEELAAWRAADKAHDAAFTRFAAAWTSLDRPLRAGAADEVLHELRWRAKRRGLRRGAVAGMTALILLFGGGFAWRLTHDHSASEAPGNRAVLVLPPQQVLPDGSVVELHEGAQIAVDFTDNARRVQLRRGEAHFQVTHNPARPFVVVVEGVQVRAVGTGFAIQLGQKAVEVLVTEGQVAVEVAPTAHVGFPAAPALAVVNAGDGVLVDQPVSGGARPRVTQLVNAEMAGRLAWRSTRLEFSGTPLAEAVTWLNRHNQVQFVIEDAELARLRVSGIFGARNTDAFVTLLEATFNARAERRGENEIVLRRAQ